MSQGEGSRTCVFTRNLQEEDYYLTFAYWYDTIPAYSLESTIITQTQEVFYVQ